MVVVICISVAELGMSCKMQELSPYEPPKTSKLCARRLAPRGYKYWPLIGFLIFASVPVAFGFYGLRRESLYYALLPPGTAACGMGSLGAMIMIVFVGPIFGFVGATCGWIISLFVPRPMK